MELAYRILQVTKEFETFHTQKHATSNSRATYSFTDDVFQGAKMGNLYLGAFLAPIYSSLPSRKWSLVALWSIVSYKIYFFMVTRNLKDISLKKIHAFRPRWSSVFATQYELEGCGLSVNPGRIGRLRME